ncbi:hypothetical protein [Cellulomonas sp. S1-8]|uniref:hypothetical protein n=1 Tax=Cellulomonas sp. S1-8 TaxID=2904790 RepID=UPI0022433A2B|nr:hypothetical protein [Cellulomonas sp. S1-8]UZN03047.1 hypothetical protein OKX07_18655 [Cellulomonas sp. S1-8]
MNQQSTSRALRVVGVLILAGLAWRKSLTSDEPWWPAVLATLVLVAVITAGVWWWSRRDDGVRKVAVGARPGWRTQAVWSDTTLGTALTQLGASAGKVRSGTRLTFAWSASDVELWRGQAVVATLPWDQVWTITRTTGYAASTGNPAVEIVTRETVRIVLVPTRRPDGGMLPASAAQVEALVAELQSAREAAEHATPTQPGSA